MTKEFWDLLDYDGNPIGETHPRGINLPENKYHKCIDAWIYNNKGEILLSQRSLDKETFPGAWEPTGGAVLAGERSLDAAVREIREELGITADKTAGTLLDTHHRNWNDEFIYNDIVDVWIFPYNETVNLNEALTNEVNAVKWISLDEFKNLSESGQLVDNLDYFYNLIEPYIKKISSSESDHNEFQ